MYCNECAYLQGDTVPSCTRFDRFLGIDCNDNIVPYPDCDGELFTNKQPGVPAPPPPPPTEAPKPNSASNFLLVANNTMKQRGETYDKSTEGECERSMGKTVEAFNAITGKDLKESDGWLLMLLLKQTRQQSSDKYHHDSALDSVAYSALLAESLSDESL